MSTNDNEPVDPPADAAKEPVQAFTPEQNEYITKLITREAARIANAAISNRMKAPESRETREPDAKPVKQTAEMQELIKLRQEQEAERIELQLDRMVDKYQPKLAKHFKRELKERVKLSKIQDSDGTLRYQVHGVNEFDEAIPLEKVVEKVFEEYPDFKAPRNISGSNTQNPGSPRGPLSPGHATSNENGGSIELDVGAIKSRLGDKAGRIGL